MSDQGVTTVWTSGMFGPTEHDASSREWLQGLPVDTLLEIHRAVTNLKTAILLAVHLRDLDGDATPVAGLPDTVLRARAVVMVELLRRTGQFELQPPMLDRVLDWDGLIVPVTT